MSVSGARIQRQGQHHRLLLLLLLQHSRRQRACTVHIDLLIIIIIVRLFLTRLNMTKTSQGRASTIVVVVAAAAVCCCSIALDISFYLLDSTFALQWHNTNCLSLITVKRLQFTGYYKTDHQLRTVLETSGNTFTQGLEIAAHCDS